MAGRALTVQNKLFLSFALVVGGLVIAVIGYVGTVVSRQAGETIADDLKASLRVFEALQREKTQNLRSLMANLSEAPRLKAALDLRRPDIATVADLAPDLVGGLDLLEIADRRGRVMHTMVRTEGSPGGYRSQSMRPAKPADPAADAYYAQAVSPTDPVVSAGAITRDGRVFLAMTGPVLVQDRIVGGLRAGFEIDERQARDLMEQTGSEVTFVVGPGKVAVTSLDARGRADLERLLTGSDLGALAKAPFDASLGGVPYVVQFAPLRDPGGRTAGWQIQMRSRSRVLGLLSRVRGGVLTIGLSGLLIAVLLGYLIARGITAPLRDLVGGTRAVDRGDLDYRIPVRTKDELGILAEAFNTMIADLKDKERVKAVFGRYLPKAVADRALAQQGDLVLGGEERDVAILFADIRGFTILSEHIPPQDLVAMLNGYFTRMVDIILDHDGTVDKYVGDAIMAIFGAPVADERAADKAVAAALEMMRALAPFNADRAEAGRPPIEIGIGVNRGLVIAGNLGSIKQLSYTVIGEEVNLASRLCANAARGQILISEAVNAKLTREFDCHRLDPITVKNVSHPVQVYEVLNERKPVGRTNTGA